MATDTPIDQEIADHPNWCSPRCRTFIAEEYRRWRGKYSADIVQRDYDLCHAFR